MINIKMQPIDVQKLSPKITVIGVGGAGGNAVNNMISSNLEGCEFLVCNTDAQALDKSLAQTQMQLGVSVTGGLGAGSRPEVGRCAAEESLDEVMQHLEGANMAFVTAGMGGGTGTGAAPIIAQACREAGILTVGVVTKPFHFEGSHRMTQAEEGIKEMQEYVDTLIVIPNQNLFRIANEKTTFSEAFKMADSVLQSGVRGVTDLMVRPGLVNLDFADIRTAMQEMGKAMMGTGEAGGDKRAIEAAESAINNPLLDDVTMKGARGVIINVTGGYDMTLFEADEACNRVRDEVDPNANIIFGATFDDSLEGQMRVSIVATGIEKEAVGKTGSYGGKLHRAQPNTGVKSAQTQQGAASVVGASDMGAASDTSGDESDTAGSGSAQAGGGSSFSAKAPEQKAIHALTGMDAVRNITAPPSATRQGLEGSDAHHVSASSGASAGVSSPSLPKEPEGDLFEQQEFLSADNAEAPQNTALRGARYKDSFIPPAPAEPGAFSQGVGPHISSFHGAHVKQATQQPLSASASPSAQNAPAAVPSSSMGMGAAPLQATNSAQGSEAAPVASGTRPQSLQLNPPKLPTGPQRRSMSLFERITNSVQSHIDGLKEGDNAGQQAAPQQQAPVSTPLTKRPAQGSLNMDSPAGAPDKKAESELDIPAFLRRQAN